MDTHEAQTGKEGREDVAKLAELVEGIRIAMLTTTEWDGTLRSRPMATQEVEFDGDLWFFTAHDSPKVREAERDQHVNVSYADPSNNRYVSVSGVAEEVRDRAKMEELWSPLYKPWFPGGLDDPDLTLLKIHVEKAEYWESTGGKLVQLLGFAKALITGKPVEGGSEHEKIRLDSAH